MTPGTKFVTVGGHRERHHGKNHHRDGTIANFLLDFKRLTTSGEVLLCLEGAILCIGYLGDQAAAQTNWREARQILDVNFIGYVLTLDLVARHFEPRRRGFICALPSVAGGRGR